MDGATCGLSVEYIVEIVEDEEFAAQLDFYETTDGPKSWLKCKNCMKVFKSKGGLRLHEKAKHAKQNKPKPTTAIIKSMLKTVGGAEQDLTPTAIEYFLDAFMTAADGHALFIKFSCDGISVIPALFQSLQRVEGLELTRKMFDVWARDQTTRNEEINQSGTELNEDEIHIVEYIGGYLLRKLKKSAKSDLDKSILKQLESDKSCTAECSLIDTLQNDDYGNLLRPSHLLMNILIKLEMCFRENARNEEVIHTLLEKVDANFILPECIDFDMAAYVIKRVCSLYFKIRAHQRARMLKSKNTVKVTISSFRKSLQH